MKAKKQGGSKLFSAFMNIPELTIILFIIIVAVFIGVQSSSFFTGTNALNITKQILSLIHIFLYQENKTT